MTRIEYIDALRTALAGLPPELIQDMVNAYEMRFIEGASAGRSEEEIVDGLDTPATVAARLRIALQAQAPIPATPAPAAPAASGAAAAIASSPARLGRMLTSLLGLGALNLFLIGPVIGFCAILFASWVGSGTLMLTGSAYSAAALSGVSEISVDGPTGRTLRLPPDMPGVVRVTSQGIRAGDEDVFDSKGKKIHVVIDDDERAPSLFLGLLAIFGGIFLFLLNLVITKYSFVGIVRYVKWNFSILRNL